MKSITANPVWPVFSPLHLADQQIKIKKGEGVWLITEDDRRILDAISSWWVNLHGHAHPQLVEALHQQAQQLEHVIFAGFTHRPAAALAELLVALTPEPLTRVFYSDNGSTAVEVMLKMALQYWRNLGQGRRTQFLAFEEAYHGDTFGAMSVGSRSIFNAAFEPLLFDVQFLPYPETWWQDSSREAKEAHCLQVLEQKLEQYGETLAGIILEPLVQGAGGMRMARPEFVRAVVARVRAAGGLVLFDEVMTGFGRTGALFAAEKCGVSPDLTALSKGLTGGFLPLSVTLCTDRIYQAFWDEDPMKTFYHAHSYTANPLGCAVAIASTQLLAQERHRFETMQARHRPYLEALQNDPRVERVRCTGTIAAFDLKTEKQRGYLNPIGPAFRRASLDKGILLRPLGQTVYIMAPYVITDDELAFIYRTIAELLETVF